MNGDGISVILFDLGRVLMHIDFDAFPHALGLYTDEERAPYRDPAARLVRTYESGAMTTEEFVEALHAMFGARYTAERILDAWNAIIVRDNDDIVPFVRSVQRRYRTALLSNTSASHWEKVMRVSSLVPSIEHRFTSFSLGVLKPDRRAYDRVAASLGVEPHRILFIDDLPENVAGAVDAGLRGITYRNAPQLLSETTFL